MRKVKVCNLCIKHPADDGRVYDKISRTLVQLGYDVHNTAPNAHTHQTPEGVFIHGFLQKAGIFGRVMSILRLYDCLKLIAPDVLFCHEPDSLLIGYIYYKRHNKNASKVKLVFDCHEAYEHWYSQNKRFKTFMRLVNHIAVIFINYIVKRSTAVTSVNQTMTERYRLLNLNSYFLPSLMSDAFLKKTDTTTNRSPRNIIYFGQFGKSHQARIFTEAASILKTKGIMIQITILGAEDNKEIDEFKQKLLELNLQNYYNFLPRLPKSDAFELLYDYSVGIMRFDSSFMLGNYAMPNKLFEYMSCGLAILACRKNIEIARIIEEEGCGILLDDETGDAFAEAILYIIANPDSVLDMGIQSYRATKEKYNWKEFGKILKHIVEVL